MIWQSKEVFKCEDEQYWGQHDWTEYHIHFPVYIAGEWEQILEEEKKKREEALAKVAHMRIKKSLEDL